jgi:hypothetical protein
MTSRYHSPYEADVTGIHRSVVAYRDDSAEDTGNVNQTHIGREVWRAKFEIVILFRRGYPHRDGSTILGPQVIFSAFPDQT